MNWRRHVPIGLLLLAGCAGVDDDGLDYFPGVGGYEASPDQARVDRSFSDIPIVTPLDQVRSRLVEVPFDGCDEHGECDWRDADGVRHYFFDDVLVVKTIDPAEFKGRPIRALEIGLVRDRTRVLAAVRKFLPEAELDCSSEGEADGAEYCLGTLRPGWLTIGFDASGSLIVLKLDGYHFT